MSQVQLLHHPTSSKLVDLDATAFSNSLREAGDCAICPAQSGQHEPWPCSAWIPLWQPREASSNSPRVRCASALRTRFRYLCTLCDGRYSSNVTPPWSVGLAAVPAAQGRFFLAACGFALKLASWSAKPPAARRASG